MLQSVVRAPLAQALAGATDASHAARPDTPASMQLDAEPKLAKNLYRPHHKVAGISLDARRSAWAAAGVQLHAAVDEAALPAPAHSFMHMGLASDMLTHLAALGFRKPVPLQAVALPILLSGYDVQLQAGTGEGKTLCFALAALVHARSHQAVRHSMAGSRAATPCVLILAPARELARQIATQLQRLAKPWRLAVQCLTPDQGAWEQQKALGGHPSVVVGTAGRVLEMCKRSALELRGTSCVVLDEADQMCTPAQLEELDALAAMLHTGRQTIMCSATGAGVMTAAMARWLSSPVMLQFGQLVQDAGKSSARLSAEHTAGPIHVHHVAEQVPDMAHKWLWLAERLPDMAADGRVLVFVATKAEAGALGARLLALLSSETVAEHWPAVWPPVTAERQAAFDEFRLALERRASATQTTAPAVFCPGYHAVAALHGDVSQAERADVAHALARKLPDSTAQPVSYRALRVVVATDLAARGMDIPGLRHVVCYSAAQSMSDYIHRAGRVGRLARHEAGYTPGTCTTLLTPRDRKPASLLVAYLHQLQQVPGATKPSIQPAVLHMAQAQPAHRASGAAAAAASGSAAAQPSPGQQLAGTPATLDDGSTLKLSGPAAAMIHAFAARYASAHSQTAPNAAHELLQAARAASTQGLEAGAVAAAAAHRQSAATATPAAAPGTTRPSRWGVGPTAPAKRSRWDVAAPAAPQRGRSPASLSLAASYAMSAPRYLAGMRY